MKQYFESPDLSYIVFKSSLNVKIGIFKSSVLKIPQIWPIFSLQENPQGDPTFYKKTHANQLISDKFCSLPVQSIYQLLFIYYFKIKHTRSFKSFYVLSTFNSLHETPTELLLESNSLINGWLCHLPGIKQQSTLTLLIQGSFPNPNLILWMGVKNSVSFWHWSLNFYWYITPNNHEQYNEHLKGIECQVKSFLNDSGGRTVEF